MYLPLPPQETCAQAWLAAATAVFGTKGYEAYNVIIDIENPLVRTDADCKIIELVDTFLREHEKYPIATIINTIFPYGLLRSHGAHDFCEAFLRVYAHIQKPHEWGHYFHRMIYHKTIDGKVINPLTTLIERLHHLAHAPRTYRNVYELSVFNTVLDLSTYNLTQDASRLRNRQCLSFLSFKLHVEKGLMLTVMYRNHYYIARGLGNLIGLGRLQEFIASEAEVPVGPLTCVSTHAEIDRQPWSTHEVHELLQACAMALRVE